MWLDLLTPTDDKEPEKISLDAFADIGHILGLILSTLFIWFMHIGLF